MFFFYLLTRNVLSGAKRRNNGWSRRKIRIRPFAQPNDNKHSNWTSRHIADLISIVVNLFEQRGSGERSEKQREEVQTPVKICEVQCQIIVIIFVPQIACSHAFFRCLHFLLSALICLWGNMGYY